MCTVIFSIPTTNWAFLSEMGSQDELGCVYSALILLDDDVAITGEKIHTILKAAKVDVEPYWPGLFAKALDGVNVQAMVTNVGVGAVGAPSGAAPSAAVPAAEKKEEKQEKEDEEPESEEDILCFGAIFG